MSFQEEVLSLARSLLQPPVNLANLPQSQEIVSESFRHALHSSPASLGEVLDLAFAGIAAGQVPPELVFELLLDAVEASSLADLESQVWPQIEARLAAFYSQSQSHQTQRAQLALLNVSNTILRRAPSSLICGRVLLWVARTLPLSDKSGCNTLGTYYPAIPLPAVEGGDLGYHRFWRMQHFFALRQPEEMSKTWLDAIVEFQQCADFALQSFEENPLSVSTATQEDLIVGSHVAAPRLFVPQVRADARFRLTIVLQLLCFVRTQQGLFATENPVVCASLKKIERRGLALLGGVGVAQSAVQSLLDREAHWEAWKRAKCPTMSSPAVSVPSLMPTVKVEGDVTMSVIPAATATVAGIPEDWAADLVSASARAMEATPSTSWQVLRHARCTDLDTLARLAVALVPPPSTSSVEDEVIVQQQDGGGDEKRLRLDEATVE